MTQLFLNRSDPAPLVEMVRHTLDELRPAAPAVRKAGGRLLIPAEHLAPARRALLDYLDPTAEHLDMDVVQLLSTAGWAAQTYLDGVLVNGPCGDYVYACEFAALLLLNPYRRQIERFVPDEPWVFSAPRERQPAFAVTFTADGLLFSADVELDQTYTVN